MPANTEMPEWRSTVVRISSMISTVLPTPAPPNIAALPPFTSGASRSITLMPVWNSSTEVPSRSMPGAGAWIGRVAISAGNGSARSIGTPIASSSRPSTGLPTGTRMGDPVARAGVPRRRPAGSCRTMPRTVARSRCCCTSRSAARRDPSRVPPPRARQAMRRAQSAHRPPSHESAITRPVRGVCLALMRRSEPPATFLAGGPGHAPDPSRIALRSRRVGCLDLRQPDMRAIDTDQGFAPRSARCWLRVSAPACVACDVGEASRIGRQTLEECAMTMPANVSGQPQDRAAADAHRTGSSPIRTS